VDIVTPVTPMIPTIRAATWADREPLVDMLGVAFSWPGPPSIDFRLTDPHLLCERRVGDHLIALDGEQIIGAAGIYGYDLRIDGVALRGAAVGQVATLPNRRRQGIMRALLQAAIRCPSRLIRRSSSACGRTRSSTPSSRTASSSARPR
jgi:GNAT superfamily N-acetyltransferase